VNFRRNNSEEVSVNLTPLIDVVFLLLIFFMVSTTFTKETHIDLELPTSSSTATNQDNLTLEIIVNASGGFVVNGQALVQSNLESLKRALQIEISELEDPSLIIVADGKAPHQSVVYALDAAGQLGLQKVRMATRMNPDESN